MSDLGLSPEFRAWLRKRDRWFRVWFLGGILVVVGAFPFSHALDWVMAPGALLLIFGGYKLDVLKVPTR